MGKSKFYERHYWDWLTQFSTAYAIGTILVVVCSLWFNGFDKAHVILEFNPFIRRLEIWGGVLSLFVLVVNFFVKWGRMAEC